MCMILYNTYLSGLSWDLFVKLRGSLGIHCLSDASPVTHVVLLCCRAGRASRAHPIATGKLSQGSRMLLMDTMRCDADGGNWVSSWSGCMCVRDGGEGRVSGRRDAVDNRSSAGLSFAHVWAAAAVDWSTQYGEGLPSPHHYGRAPL